ncbi:hypothetical protein PHISCL_04367 [Aspergillus sclerotialis]|uniref:Uncharacterized protein n=1 Tax=Aspergillus sclerotialis TaxID=2070753 RepID=A0A3A2ZLX1_9EURO|nr:hypothetical protein PHISCL_04367 [Aspergillus sclerotialis]
MSVNYNPLVSRRFPNLIRIGNFHKAVTLNELHQETQSVRMRNDDEEFNCQSWVMTVLKSLAEDGWLTNAQSATGADATTEGILEAEDDEK